jgi:hypothetical protein
MRYLRKNTRHKQKKGTKRRKQGCEKRKRSQTRKKKRRPRHKNKRRHGGNLFPNPVYDKIVSIGYELESPFLIPLRDSDKNSKGEFFPHLYQIPPDRENHHYDIYYEYTTPQRDETFKIITDNETTEFNVKIHNSPENIQINNLPVYVLVKNEKDEEAEDLGGLGGLGHTEFLITFYKPAKHDQIIQTTLQKSIRYIHHYLQQLESLDVTVQIKGHAALPWKMFRDERGNYYLPSFTDLPLSSVQNLDAMKRDMKFTIQMTFGSKFTDCILVVQHLLANTNNTNLQEHAVFLNTIVQAVNTHVTDPNGAYTPRQMDYIKTFLILILYRYETFKKYEEKRKTNPATLYKYECYFYIRHHFEDLRRLVQHQLGDKNAHKALYQEYTNIVENEPQYDSEYLDDFLMGEPDYLSLSANQIDYYSTKFPVQQPNDVVLIEFRGFHDELEQLITTYTPPSKHRQIQQDLEECSERIVGCYSLDTLNTLAAVDFATVDKAKKDKQQIMEAPRPSRTRKAPSRFDDA